MNFDYITVVSYIKLYTIFWNDLIKNMDNLRLENNYSFRKKYWKKNFGIYYSSIQMSDDERGFRFRVSDVRKFSYIKIKYGI